MHLGLTLGLGMRVGPNGFSPASLPMELWVKAPFAASPWTGNSSAGGSGSRNLSEATNPPSAGAALSGRATADFDGTNDRLVGAAPLTFIDADEWSAIVLFKADTAAADVGATFRRLNPALVAADNATWGVHFASDGVSLTHSDGVSSYERVVAANTANWHLAQAKLLGGDLSLRVDSGAWSTLGSVPNGSFVTAATNVGKNFTTTFYDGLIAEIMLSKTGFSADEFDDIKDYVNAWSGLSL